jgi:nucleoside-diphosphate-sugar epimerase
MKCLVTGAAGFIGSSLAEKLIDQGHQVLGVDCFTDYYPRNIKEQNLENLLNKNNFAFQEKDLCVVDLRELLSEIEVVFHQAAQAGVRTSWGSNFEVYLRNNIEATQKLLEACKEKPLKKLIFASSSSVYGDNQDVPMREESYPRPISPYGVTKSASEELGYLYFKSYGVPVISLRYFTVYGPRQRPDMAFHKFIKALLTGEEIAVFGDGKQTRDFTYISDIVDANISAMESNFAGTVFNIGGGSRISLIEAIRLLEEITGKKANLKYSRKSRGDMKDTAADISQAQKHLNYKPKFSLKEGLKNEVEWVKNNLGLLSS